MTTQQPKALRLADLLQLHGALPGSVSDESGNELRRLHALNAELVEALKNIIGSPSAHPNRGLPSEKKWTTINALTSLVTAGRNALAKAEGGEA